MDQPAQIITEPTQPPASINFQSPPSAPKSNKGPLIFLLVILGLILVGGLIYEGYKLGQFRSEPGRLQAVDCQNDSDCVLVLDRKEECCRCPIAVNKSELVRNKNLVIYLPGEIGWSQVVLPECKNIACSPCPWWSKTICESGLCRGAVDLSPTPSPFVSTPTPDPTAGWKIYTNSTLGFELKYPSGWYIKDQSSSNLIQVFNYDVDKAPGRSYNPKVDGNLFKIEIYIDKESSDIDLWFEKENIQLNPVTDKPNEFLNVKKITIGSNEGLFYEVEDSLSGLKDGVFTIKSPKGGLIHFWGGLNYEGNKNYFDQILATFKFLPSEETVNWKTYTSKENELSFKYPSGWYYKPVPGYEEHEVSFFEIGTEADHSYGDHSGNEVFTVDIKEEDRSLEELKRLYYPSAVDIIVAEKSAISSNNRINVKISPNKVVSIMGGRAKKYLDQILSTFKFLP